MRAVVLSDTHIRRGRDRGLPPAVYDALRSCDVILHAGDVLIPEFLDELRTYAPVHAVLGNNDHELFGVLPQRLEVDLDGVRVAMIHDAGGRAGRPSRVRRMFPDADLVVYGHSHEPDDSEGVDGQRLLNPGSPTERRRQPRHTYAELDCESGSIRAVRIIPLD